MKKYKEWVEERKNELTEKIERWTDNRKKKER